MEVVVVVVGVVVVCYCCSPSPLFVVSGFLSLFLEESSGKNVVSPLRRWLVRGVVESNSFF